MEEYLFQKMDITVKNIILKNRRTHKENLKSAVIPTISNIVYVDIIIRNQRSQPSKRKF